MQMDKNGGGREGDQERKKRVGRAKCDTVADAFFKTTISGAAFIYF
jgi:hypothetical protein